MRVGQEGLPQQEHVVPRQVVDVLRPLQQHQLRQDGHRFQVDGECPEELLTQRGADAAQNFNGQGMLGPTGQPRMGLPQLLLLRQWSGAGKTSRLSGGGSQTAAQVWHTHSEAYRRKGCTSTKLKLLWMSRASSAQGPSRNSILNESCSLL